jgi:galactokinase/mevalonate kinase-like predicted kinase
MTESKDEELVTLNITMSKETEQEVMTALFIYYTDILRAMKEVKHEDTEYAKKTREKRERICQNLVKVMGDKFSWCEHRLGERYMY